MSSSPTSTPSPARSPRWFLALWPDAELRARLAAAAGRLRSELSGQWIRPENLHLTLAFLGGVEAERQAAVHGVAAAIRNETFRLELDHVEFWPRNGVICLAPARTPPGLQTLAGELAAGLRNAGFALEQRAYRAHLTLARRGRSAHARMALPRPLHWEVDRFVLVESQPGPLGSDYAVLATWPLVEPASRPPEHCAP